MPLPPGVKYSPLNYSPLTTYPRDSYAIPSVILSTFVLPRHGWTLPESVPASGILRSLALASDTLGGLDDQYDSTSLVMVLPASGWPHLPIPRIGITYNGEALEAPRERILKDRSRCYRSATAVSVPLAGYRVITSGNGSRRRLGCRHRSTQRLGETDLAGLSLNLRLDNIAGHGWRREAFHPERRKLRSSPHRWSGLV